MKKKLLWIAGILAALVLIATLAGPSIILTIVRQPVPAEEYAYSESFLTDYESVRRHVQELSASLGAQSYSHAIDEQDGLYIDTFYLPAGQAQPPSAPCPDSSALPAAPRS